MCKKKPGLRCAHDTSKCMTKAKEALEANKVALDSTEAARDAAETEAEFDALNAKVKTITARRVLLEAAHENAQREYDMTATGLEELKETLEDSSLTTEQLEDLQKRLKVAEEGREQRKNKFREREVRKANILHMLNEAGVDPEAIAEVVAYADNHNGLANPRQTKDYKKPLTEARAAHKLAKENVEVAEAEARKKARAEGLDAQATEKAVAQAVRKAEKEREASLARLKTARFNYNCTKEGQEALEAELAECPPEAYLLRAKLSNQLRRVKKFHADGLSARRNREHVKKKFEAALRSVGKSEQEIKAATEALKLKVPLVGEAKLAPHELRTSIKAVLTETEQNQLRNAFHKSKDFKEGGEDAYNSWVMRRVMASPVVRQTAKSIDEANAQAAMGFDSRPHRHYSSPDGKRSADEHFKMTTWQARKIKGYADTLEMSTSSYVRAMATGTINPFAIQNDRSAEHNKKKAKAAEKAYKEWSEAA